MMVKVRIISVINAVLTTICAFMSLVFSDIKPVMDFGWMMTYGLLVSFALSFLLLPSLILVFNPKVSVQIKEKKSKFAELLAYISTQFPKLIYSLSVFLIVFSIYGISKLKVENSFINYYIRKMEKVLVTGATGFIGLHCIDQLLNQGYAVNGSLRSPKRKDEIFNALKNKNTPTENLNLFIFNLTEDDGWDEGMKGCDYLLHIASPLSVKAYDDDFFVKPAVAGVKRAFKFAMKHNVKKVVLTSSVAAIIETDEDKEYFDETDWSDLESKKINSYAKSKTLAEKAAWDFVKEHENPFELAVVNPALVTGPSLTEDLGESNKSIEMVVTGKMPVAIPMQFGFVDVRDVAAAHILAMQKESSNGERFALSEKDLSYKEIAKILRDKGFKKAPKISVSLWVAKFLANFNKDLKITVPYMGKIRSLSKSTKAKDILGWNPRPAEESILDVANQIKEMGLIK